MIDVRQLSLDGIFEIRPRRFEDERGFVAGVYNSDTFKKAGLDLLWVQDNHSYSAVRGTLRGLHYQLPPAAQGKLVRVVRGAIFDVAVDIRRKSSSFGRWAGLELSAAAGNQIFIPSGFAHGFVTLEDNTEVIYKMSSTYSVEHERSIRFDDSDIGIDWPIGPGEVRLSPKDRSAPRFADADVFD